MSTGVGFLVFLGVTLGLLAVVVTTGRAAARRVHLIFVALSFASLGITIWFAELLGESYDLETAGWLFPFHLTLAKLAVASYVLPVVSGIATLRNPRRRRLHGRIAWLVLALTVATAVSGAAMVYAAEPLG